MFRDKRLGTIRTGTNERETTDGDFYQIERIIKHEKYEGSPPAYDICVIQAMEDIAFTHRKVTPIAYSPNYFREEAPWQKLIGWGDLNVRFEKFEDFSNQKHFVNERDCYSIGYSHTEISRNIYNGFHSEEETG